MRKGRSGSKTEKHEKLRRRKAWRMRRNDMRGEKEPKKAKEERRGGKGIEEGAHDEGRMGGGEKRRRGRTVRTDN
jgi:hypothetical protein